MNKKFAKNASLTAALLMSVTTFAAGQDADKMEEQIEKRFSGDATLKACKSCDIDVEFAGGVATLTGDVPTEALRARAERLAKVSGVTRVVNNLAIEADTGASAADKTRSGLNKAADATADAVGTAADKTRSGVAKAAEETKEAVGTAADKTRSGVGTAADRTEDATGTAANKTGNTLSKTGEVITDAWITTKVKASFLGDDPLKGSNIDVDTKDNVVTLKGTVQTDAAKAHAETKAKQIEGVKRVVNSLRVAPKTN